MNRGLGSHRRHPLPEEPSIVVRTLTDLAHQLLALAVTVSKQYLEQWPSPHAEPLGPKRPSVEPSPRPFSSRAAVDGRHAAWRRYAPRWTARTRANRLPASTDNRKTSKENKAMELDHNLSGDDVKVVQYAIISVVTTCIDNAEVLIGPSIIAFGDDMSSADFAAWVINLNAEEISKIRKKCEETEPMNCLRYDHKYLRVSYFVMSRFSRADINWDELQANSVAMIARNTTPKSSSK